jgi:regulator of cell morphogenesis and NO signaling
LIFCCNGKRTLADACNEKGIPITAITGELDYLSGIPNSSKMPFTEMNAEQLISYILINHHFYVKQSMPTILQHLQKIALKHGDRHPNMIRVFQLFTTVNEEMLMHMHKEENILFPKDKEIENDLSRSVKIDQPAAYLTAPIEEMEMGTRPGRRYTVQDQGTYR